MATTTATLTLASSDLLTDNLSLSSTMSLLKGSDALKDNSNYVYIMNKNTDVTDYLVISINNEIIGKLYAGDWAFFPWACDLSAAANDSTIEIQAYTHEAIVEYALFHVGETLVTSADS